MTNPTAAEAAHDLLGRIGAAARKARTRAWSPWFPLTVFGVLIAGSAWWYRDPGHLTGGPPDSVVPLSRLVLSPQWTRFAGGIHPHPEAALYWAVALPFGYLLCAWWYARRAVRVGVQPAWRTYVGTGALFAALLALTLLLHVGAPTGGSPGWGVATPFLAVALGFAVLALLQRSRGLLLFAVVDVIAAGFVGATSLSRAGSTGPLDSAFVQVLALAALPLAAAAVTWVRARTGRAG